jgi:molecular chaperone GrpE
MARDEKTTGYKIPINVIPTRGSRSDTDREAEKPDATDAMPAGSNVPRPESDDVDWKSVAMRLQADMENFRKRQERRADDAIDEERQRLLGLMLTLSDNLDRVLQQTDATAPALMEGVDLTQRELTRQMSLEGVTRIEAVGQAFTPEWHEAVVAIPDEAPAGTVVEEIQPGFKLNGRLLRPARVVVAA